MILLSIGVVFVLIFTWLWPGGGILKMWEYRHRVENTAHALRWHMEQQPGAPDQWTPEQLAGFETEARRWWA